MTNFKSLIVDSGKEMLSSGLTVGTWGNISVRDAETGNIYITPSGMNYDTCTEDDIVVFDSTGKHIEGSRKPSIEKDLHIAIFQKREDVNAIIHTHPIYSMIFAVTEQGIPSITDEFAQIVGDYVYCAKYALPGSKELADNTANCIGNENAVLLANHGAVCVGSDMKTAFKVCLVLEKTAQILYMSRQMGIPRIIPMEDVKIMQEFVKTKYGQK